MSLAMLGESSAMLMERFRRKIEDQTRMTLQFQNFTIVDMLALESSSFHEFQWIVAQKLLSDDD
jgi:hypothetical protein